jgi:hypothetical protein
LALVSPLQVIVLVLLSIKFETMRCSGFAPARNSLRIARLLTTASLMNPLYAV